MVKSTLRSLLKAITVILVLAVTSPALKTPASQSDAPYRTILALEQARSLGDGALAAFLNGSDPQLAARAALAIGRTKQPEGRALLAAHVADRNPGIRAMSVYGLGLLGDGSSGSKIARLLASDKNGAVAVADLDALGRLETAKLLTRSVQTQACGAIIAALKRSSDPILRARAASSLESFRESALADTAAAALVAAFRNESNGDVRWHIMWTAFRGYPTRVPRAFLTAGLRGNDELVRIEAVRAYGRLKNTNAVAALIPLLNDPSWRVQEQAIESIKALRGQPLSDHLISIPAGVHIPPVKVQNYMELAPLPRPSMTGKPSAPTPDQALYEPKLGISSSASMNGPLAGPHPRVRIKTTKGTIVVELFPEWAPLTVANFLNLANRGYYDGNRWFRIVPDFVTQTGDPNDNGNGDAGFTVGAEENPLEQVSGVLSMGMNYDAKGPIRDSAGTQFYITVSPQLHLDRDFTVFGRVTNGFDVLGRLVESDRMVRVEQIPDSSK